MSKRKHKQPKSKPERTIADLERIINERPIRGLSHAWIIGAAKKELERRTNEAT